MKFIIKLVKTDKFHLKNNIKFQKIKIYFKEEMKSHIYRINLCIHSISIHVSFPCTVGASLQIDNQQSQITDNVDIKQAQLSINATTQTEVSLLFNPRTNAYSMKKAVINFFLKTKSGKLQAGSTAIFLNKSLQGCTKQVAQISKCSDRQATVQYSMHLELLQETQTNMTASMFKSSQISDANNNSMRNSTVSYSKRFFDQTNNLYQSIVQQVDDKTDQAWQKGSNCSKGSAGNTSFISDLKHIQSSKNISSGWRNNQNQSSFRKSRLQGSVVQHRKTTSSYVNNATYQNKLSVSKANFQQFQQDTKNVLEKKVSQLEKQNKQMKQTLNMIRQKYEDQIFQEKTSLRKSQIVQTSLKEQLELMRQKFGSLEQQSNKMLFEKNQILNKYNTRQTQNISQVKAREKAMTLQNKRLSEKSQKLQRALTEQQEKCRNLQKNFKQQQTSLNKKLKQYEYYQHEAMELDQKLSQLRLVEDELHKEIENLKQQMSKQQENYKKQLQKYKKQFSSIKQVKDQQSKGLSKQMTNLRTSIRQKQTQVNSLKRQFEGQKKKLNQQISILQQQKQKQQKQWKRINQLKGQEQQNSLKLQQTIYILEQKLRNMVNQMNNLIENRDQCLGELQCKLQELNVQQFKLNEQNFELQQKFAIQEKCMIEKQNHNDYLTKQLAKTHQILANKEFEYNKLAQQLQQTISFRSSNENESKILKIQLSKKQQEILCLQHKMEDMLNDYNNLQKHNHDLQVETQLKLKQKDDQINALHDRIYQLQTSLNQQSTDIKQLNDHILSLNTKRQTLNTQNESINSINLSLEEQIQQKQTLIQSLNDKINQLTTQLADSKSQALKQKKNTQQKDQFQTNMSQCIEVFEELFGSILSKDFQTIAATSKKINPYKYNNLGNKNLSSSSVKKSSQQTTDLKRLNLFSTKKNILFAQNLSSKLQELQLFLIQIFEKQEQKKQEINKLNKQIQTLQTQTQNKTTQINDLQTYIETIQKQNNQFNEQINNYSKTLQKNTKQSSSFNIKIKELEATAQRQKGFLQDLRKDVAAKNKQILTLKGSINKNEQYLKQTQNAYKQSKDRMQIEVNSQVNQLKSQVIEMDKQVNVQKQQVKRKQTRISQLQALIQEIKGQNTKILNESKKQNIELKKQLNAVRKQGQKKNYQVIRLTAQQTQLTKKIQTITVTSKQNLQKFQKSNQQLLTKNKQINQLQVSIRDKVSQISKSNIKARQFQQQINKIKKQKQDMNKSLIAQQELNSKNIITIKQLKEIIQKKQQAFKQTQKQLKIMEGQIFNQKRIKTQQPSQQSDTSLSNSTYSYKKIQHKKQNDTFSPTVSAFSYKKNVQSTISQQIQSQNQRKVNEQVKYLKQQISTKQKIILQMQQKIYSKMTPNKQSCFSKTNSSLVETSTSKIQQIMRQQILENLQLIQAILSSPDTGNRFDKYKIELSSLINKNKKIILEASPFQQMRKLNMLIQKAKTSIQNKLKIQNQAKTFILDEFIKIQTIVDEVMGK